MILDKLLEKKDLVAYTDWRIKQLNKERQSTKIKGLPEKERERFKATLFGRVKELKHLKTVTLNQGIKEESKRISNGI